MTLDFRSTLRIHPPLGAFLAWFLLMFAFNLLLLNLRGDMVEKLWLQLHSWSNLWNSAYMFGHTHMKTQKTWKLPKFLANRLSAPNVLGPNKPRKNPDLVQMKQALSQCPNQLVHFKIPQQLPTDVDGKLHQVHQVQRITSLPRYGFSMTARNPRMPSGCQTCRN